MDVHPRFERLLELSAPLWAGEAEVARTYFDSGNRTAETDQTWISRQCYKEFWGSGFVDPDVGVIGEWSRKAVDMVPQLEDGLPRGELLDLLEQIYAEYHHFCLFANIYERLGGEGTKLTPRMLSNWDEGEALDVYRAGVRKEHGALGQASLSFTEGGYCTLYSEGLKLEGRGGVDDEIGTVCRRVYDDEMVHLVNGMAAVGREVDGDAEWDLLEELVVTQLRMRVTMRNGQFGYPLSSDRISEIHAGDIEPLTFDYGLVAQAA